MKKIVSVVLILTMFMSLFAVSAVETAAESTGLTAAYASVKPTIDCEIDPIWDTTMAIKMKDKNKNELADYVKLLWDEDGTYFLFVFSSLTWTQFCVTGKKTTNYWDNSNCGYGLTIEKKDGTWDVSVPWYISSSSNGLSVLGHELKVKDTANGFIVEAFVPIRGTEITYSAGHTIGFSARSTDNAWSDGTSANFAANSSAANCLATVTLIENPGLPQAQSKSVSMRGVQTTAVTDGKYDARLIAEIDKLDYEKAGFALSFTYGGKKQDVTLDTTVAYTSVLAGGETVSVTKEGNYLIAVILADIPEDAELNVTVTPYTMSGEIASNGNSGSFTLKPTAASEN